MESIGISELRQHASQAVRRVAGGESIIVTDRGRPVARLVPTATSGIAHLIETGRARPPIEPLSDLPPAIEAGNLSQALRELRDEERY